jgi:anti-sigma regulatory factor (Ser/Thr protein kinase)
MVGPDERSSTGDVLTPPERAPLDQLFDGDGLFGLRSAVAAHASAFGLSELRVSDLVLVAHELATNAVRHGGATPATPGRLRLWVADGVVVCQVFDPGPGPQDLSGVGIAQVDPSARSGRGLFIVRRLSRRLDIATGTGGTTITAVLPNDPSIVD